ncbi:MAG TPA: roadblock/LC7 domain-containing protein [Cryptosporangiaceae bacterium]|nr:roadblock/LC7 domain-containing protein [Cryptosporangiaceae bacterium]
MTIPAHPLSANAENFSWLLSRFSEQTPGVREVIAVSADGLLMSMSSGLDRNRGDQLAAITSAIVSLASGASRCYDLGETNKVVIDLERGYLMVSSISAGSALGVLADRNANLGTIAYEVAVFVNRASPVLSPQLIDELRRSLAY